MVCMYTLTKMRWILRWQIVMLLPTMFLLPKASLCSEDEDVVNNNFCSIGTSVQLKNGSLVFTNLSSRSEKIAPSYDGGPIGSWFTLARHIVNAIAKEDLPYGKYYNYVIGSGKSQHFVDSIKIEILWQCLVISL